MVVGGSVGWVIYRGVGYGFGSASGITFAIDDGSEIFYYGDSRDNISVIKYVKVVVVVIIDDSIGWVVERILYESL